MKIVFHCIKSNKNWALRFNPSPSRSIPRSTWQNAKWMEKTRMRGSKTTMLTLRLTTNPRDRSEEEEEEEFLKNSVDVVQFVSLWCFLSLLRYGSQCIRQRLDNNHHNSSSNSKQNKTFFFSFHPSFISSFLRCCLVFYVRLFVTSLTADIRTFRVDWRDGSLHLCCNSFSFF